MAVLDAFRYIYAGRMKRYQKVGWNLKLQGQLGREQVFILKRA